MCEPITLAALSAAGTYGAASAGIIGATAATAATATTAATVATTMTTMQALSLAATVGSTVMAAGSAYQQSQIAQQTANNNAKTAEIQAQDAQRRGEKDAIAIQQKGAAFKSAQRVSLATKGLDLAYGTAADLQDQTDFFSQSDAATARTNAAKEAWSMRARGANYQAEAMSNSPYMAAGGSLLAGGAQVADKWYRYKSGNLDTRYQTAG